MRQLPLPILAALSYGPDGFIRHAGVRAVLEECFALGQSSAFALRYVEGGSRAGKTHASLRLHADFVDWGREVLLLDGTGGRDAVGFRGRTPTSNLVVIVDDADRYFDALKPEDEGGFVSLVEELRAVCGKLFLFSGKPIAELRVDDHVLSRLRLAAGLRIEAPGEEEVRPLLELLARQRGLRLKPRELGFLQKRLGRDIKSLEYYLERLHHLSQVLAQPIRFPLVANAV